MAEATKAAKRVKVILVHGTFATNASWDDDPLDEITRDGGDPKNILHRRQIDNKSTGVFVPALRKLLREQGEGVELVTERFLWSGLNSHEARRAAAVALALRLQRGFPTRYDPVEQDYTAERLTGPQGREVPADEEFDEVYVIAHSHGGTIARLAMNLLPEEAKPTGVITFGSPFVRFKPRRIDSVTRILSWLIRVLAVLALGLIVLLTLGDALPGASLFDDPAKTAAFYAALVLGFGYVFDWAIRQGREKLHETQEMLLRDYDPEPKAQVEFLSYHAVFDEAGIWLRILSFVTWIFQTIVVTTLNSAYFITFMVIVGLIYGSFAWFGYPSPEWTNRIFSPVVIGYNELAPLIGLPPARAIETFCLAKWLPGGVIISGFVTFILLVVLTLIAAPVSILLPWAFRSSGIGFGGEKLSWTLASEIDVDRTANQTSELRVIFMPSAWLKGRIQHNYYYDAPKIQGEIADRIARWRYARRRFDWSIFERYPLFTLRALFQAGVILMMLSGAMYFSAELAKDFDPSFAATGGFCDPEGAAGVAPPPSE